MSTTTANLQLKKPAMSDQIRTTITDIANNLDIIDSSLAQKSTQLNDIAVNAKTLGVKNNDDVNNGINNSTIINNALTNNTIVFLPAGTYNISSTIVIPKKKKLLMDEQAIIKPTQDIDIFVLNDHSVIEGGTVLTSNVANYSKSIITFSSNWIYNVKLKGLRAKNNTDTPSGTGINLDTTSGSDKFITFSYFEDFHIEGFKYGLYLKNTAPMNFTNANYFSGLINSCIYAFYCDANGNYFNVLGEVGNTTNNEPVIYINGTNNNIDAVIFDVGRVGASSIGLQVEGETNIINTNFGLSRIIDHTGGRNIYPQMFLQIPPSRSTAQYTNRGTYFAGDQSNYLVSADKRFTVTESLTNVSNWSSLSNAFILNSTTDLVYHFTNPSSLTDNAQVIIDFGSAKVIKMVGTTLRLDKHCKKVVFEYYSTYDNQWHSNTLLPSNSGSYLWDIGSSGASYNLYSNITKLRISYFQPASADIYIHNIFAASSSGGNAFLPISGGVMYADIDLNKNKMKNMVLDQGVTANRPTSPVIGQVFFDTTIGKPIYCKVGGSTPTWVDAIGTTV